MTTWIWILCTACYGDGWCADITCTYMTGLCHQCKGVGGMQVKKGGC